MERPADQAALGVPPPARGLGKVFRAFSYRDYRLLWSGAFVSSCGTWMQEFAQNWLIFTMTRSPFWLSLDAFLAEAPFLIFSLLGGVVADRYDRRKILLGSQVVQLTNAFVLAALVFFHRVAIWHILGLSFLTGFAQSFGGPAYQALVPSFVRKEDVPNAVALQSIQFNLARVVGPVLAGVAFAKFGAAACFSLNGLSFFVVIAALLLIKNRFLPKAEGHPPVLKSLRQGIDFVRGNSAMQALVVLAFAGSFFAFPLVTFLPVFAETVLSRGASGYSHMLAYFGVGAVAGALGMASLGNFARKGVKAIAFQFTFCALMVAFALSRTFGLSCAILVLAGAALVMVFATFMSLVQLLVEDDMRGRVGSVYTLAFRGAMPLGNIVSGAMAARTSVSVVLVVNGVLLALVCLVVLGGRRTELSQI